MFLARKYTSMKNKNLGKIVLIYCKKKFCGVLGAKPSEERFHGSDIPTFHFDVDPD
jgi:hypothetical protein